MPPHAADGLSLGRYGPKLLLKFEQSVRDKVIGNWLPVIEPEREQNLVVAGVICSYVAGPSTWKEMFSVARKPSAASGTSISPVAQLLKGNRPARRPNARFLASRSVKRIRIMISVWQSG